MQFSSFLVVLSVLYTTQAYPSPDPSPTNSGSTSTGILEPRDAQPWIGFAKSCNENPVIDDYKYGRPSLSEDGYNGGFQCAIFHRYPGYGAVFINWGKTKLREVEIHGKGDCSDKALGVLVRKDGADDAQCYTQVESGVSLEVWNGDWRGVD